MLFDGIPVIELMNTMMLMLAVTGGMYFMMIWRRDRRMESMMTREELQLQRKELSMQAESGLKSDPNKGGYININIPEEHKSMFQDFLKGFEDYSALKGYKVVFSSDSESPEFFSFKFTIVDSGISVSTEKVREDFNDYLKKIESGDSLDTLPVVTSPEEHDLLLTKLKNRINFLQHSYNLSKNTVEYYERLLKSAPLGGGFNTAPPVIVQTGGQLDAKSYQANGSSNLIQGDHSNLTSITNDNSISIANSFNKRKQQVEGLDELIGALRKEADDKSSIDASVELEKIKSELTDEEEPDKNRVEKWLNKASGYLNTAKKSKEVFDKAKEVYTSFNMPGLIESIGSAIS
jgi:hypothetical protein